MTALLSLDKTLQNYIEKWRFFSPQELLLVLSTDLLMSISPPVEIMMEAITMYTKLCPFII